MRLSVIIPTLNEAQYIEDTLRHARRPGVLEIIVVDGGSTDATRTRAEELCDRIVSAPAGRAVQMNAGAAAAHGDVLLFLHADTLLPAGCAAAVEGALRRPQTCGGRFDLRLEPSSFLLWLTAELINLRSRWSGISTGDQAIFVRREVFERLGGFREMPLMEDVELTTRMKRVGEVAALSERVVTSSRRWIARGVVRTILLMWSLRLLYFAGVSPQRLRSLYADQR